MANEGRHIDIIEMDAASSRKIDDIRDLIEHTKYRPASAKVKIFIIDEVHMLTKEAHNALLKTLEEPPEYVKFILATTDPLKLPPTILSRTQHFRFKRISHPNIVHHLSHILHLENIEYQAEALDILARSGSGSLRDTLTLMDQAIIYSKGFVDVKTVADMLGLLDPDYISRLFDSIFAKDRASLILMLQELEAYESEMVVDELIAYLKERLYEGDHRFSPLVIERFFRILSDAKTLFAINADGGFVVSLVLFKMIEALKIKEIDEMIESLESRITHAPTKAPSTLSTSEAPTIHITPTPPTAKLPFEQLCDRISDRSIELGECFKSNVTFLSFEDNTLTWESCADGEEKELLKNSFGIIRQFVREIYGIDTQIKSNACTKTAETISEDGPLVPEPEMTLAAEAMPETIDEPASMVEEAEIGVGSCVSQCDETSIKEFDGSDVLKEPMIQKAAELFEATKITVQSKV
jgi:DNA polymerase-3 subunit gamma/tau